MADQAHRTARRLEAAAIAAMLVSALFLAVAWYLSGEILNAFCLGVSFASLSASVLLLSYANYVRFSASDKTRTAQFRRSIGEK